MQSTAQKKGGPSGMMIGIGVLVVLLLLFVGLFAWAQSTKDKNAKSSSSTSSDSGVLAPAPAPTPVPAPAPAPPPDPVSTYTKRPLGGDWWGNDIASYPTSDATTCAKNCNDAPDCVAFVTATDSQNCWLKRSIDSNAYHDQNNRQYYTKPGVNLPAPPPPSGTNGCRACYGAKADPCNTCNEVIQAYQGRGWAYNQNLFKQCNPSASC